MGCVYGKCCKRYHLKGKENGQSIVHKIPVFAERSLECISVPSHHICLEYSVLTQRGFYPDSPEKDNQDSYVIRTQLQDNPNIHFFGVFDGHGQFGAQCSNFVKDKLVDILSSDESLLEDPVKAFSDAFLRTNEELHSSDIDDAMSGTTAITALVIGNKVYVANVGDSRAVIAVRDGNQIVAQDLSRDQTPFRKDEYERVKLCGARVLSVDQVEGLKDPNIQTWGDEETEGNDPPRLWVQNGMYPGTAFTRSVGDSTAENIGVIAAPEVSVVQLTQDHLFFVVASDGVFEFLPSQAVVDMVSSYQDPRDACSAIVGESYKLWLTHENRTDDITVIIVHIKGLSSVDTPICRGVIQSRNRNGKWGSQIYVNKKVVWLGTYDSQQEAALAFDRVALKLCRFASINFPLIVRTREEVRFQSMHPLDSIIDMIKTGTYRQNFEEFFSTEGNFPVMLFGVRIG